MRLIALSIVVLAGSFMASAGVIAEALPSVRKFNQLDTFGLLLIGFACLLFLVEWFSGLPNRTAIHDKTARSTVDVV